MKSHQRELRPKENEGNVVYQAIASKNKQNINSTNDHGLSTHQSGEENPMSPGLISKIRVTKNVIPSSKGAQTTVGGKDVNTGIQQSFNSSNDE